MRSSAHCQIIFTSLIIFIFTGALSCGQEKQELPMNCTKWMNKVVPDLGGGALLEDSTPSDQEIFEAISCLLQLQGDKRQARFGGVTRLEVSQILPTTTIELAALYYISYLYDGRWQHADGVALWNRNGVINPPGSVETAYMAYKKWFEKVKKIGLEAARKESLEPLKGTGLYWYGN